MTSRRRSVSALAISDNIGPGVFARDGAHGIDMLIDQRDRDAADLGSVFEQSAQALGDAG